MRCHPPAYLSPKPHQTSSNFLLRPHRPPLTHRFGLRSPPQWKPNRVSSDYITGVEFTNYFSQKLGLKHGQMSHLYDIFDKDNSGKIEFNEFAVLCSARKARL